MSRGVPIPADQLDDAGREFLNIVRMMREAQRRYFSKRDQGDLIEAKRLERIVDEAIIQETMGLFGGANGQNSRTNDVPAMSRQAERTPARQSVSGQPRGRSVPSVQLGKVHRDSRRSAC